MIIINRTLQVGEYLYLKCIASYCLFIVKETNVPLFVIYIVLIFTHLYIFRVNFIVAIDMRISA